MPTSDPKIYFVLAHDSGRSIREHDFQKAQDGGYLFTEDEARRKILSPSLILPVALRVDYLERMLPSLFPEMQRIRDSGKSGAEDIATRPQN